MIASGVWRDLGVVFSVRGQAPWMTSHGYVPTACVQKDHIRVFAAFWDSQQIGRVGYVDVEREDPSKIIGFSARPVLDVGIAGAFDEHGVTPMAVVPHSGILRLYYAGWQRSPTVRYFLFTGIAVSYDGGDTFSRLSDVPVLDRVPGHDLVRTGFFDYQDGMWKAWIAQSDGLIDVCGRPTPTYSLAYLQSPNGIEWPQQSLTCLKHGVDGIFGFGRSAIWRNPRGYHAMLSVRRMRGYRIEYAQSKDGIVWSAPSNDGYALPPEYTVSGEAETMFPSRVHVDGQTYVFYNGNRFGAEGIRCAHWETKL
jgi:hypothetical protein